MKKPDFALKIALKSKSINDGRVFINLRNKVVNELRKEKANFFMTINKEGKGNRKLIWKNINKLTKTDSQQNQGHGRELKVQGIITNEFHEIAAIFNKYFIDLSTEFVTHLWYKI